MLKIIGNGEHAAVIRDSVPFPEKHNGSIIGIGDIYARRAVAVECWPRVWTIVKHPSCMVSSEAKLFGGVFVGARAVINRGVTIWEHVIINTGAIVEHDVKVGAFSNIGPGVVIGGGAKIGHNVLLGLGCCIRDHVKIGNDATVGMGAVVVEDVPPGVTVMGVPAKVCL